MDSLNVSPQASTSSRNNIRDKLSNALFLTCFLAVQSTHLSNFF
uniref:Uncharacterized protein n=1 Tax=Arundo donax TaxID=35708 RepID=A0A0A8ZRT3_ARUDO